MGISNRICSKAGQVDFSTAEKSTRPAFEQILLEIPMEEPLQLRGKVNISQLQGEIEFNTFLCDKPYN